MQTPIHTFKLRLPHALLVRVDEETRRSRRSKTQEIIVAIEAHLERLAEPRLKTGGQPAVGQEA
jgi:predicted DNA-binding protein